MTDKDNAANDREITEQELDDVSGGLIPKAGSSEFSDVTMAPPAPSTTPRRYRILAQTECNRRPRSNSHLPVLRQPLRERAERTAAVTHLMLGLG